MMRNSNTFIFTNIIVQNPRFEEGAFTSYAVFVETNDPSFKKSESVVRRRYSEFVTLRQLLCEQFPPMNVPCLPAKHPFKSRFHPDFVEKRRVALQEFLNQIVSKKIYLSSKAFHYFLQSSLGMKEIRDIISGRSIVNDASCDDEPSAEKFQAILYSPHFLDEITEKDGLSHEIPEGDINSAAHRELQPFSEHSASSSPSGRKHVSFCDRVIVAQIHN